MTMKKAPDAFRTISEVADWLGVSAHVLRFWESKFTQVKPTKRAGGRRYYRVADMELLGGIRHLLYEDGMTIKGAQKVLREKGVKAVAALSPPVDPENAAPREDSAPPEPTTPPYAERDVQAASPPAPLEPAVDDDQLALFDSAEVEPGAPKKAPPLDARPEEPPLMAAGPAEQDQPSAETEASESDVADDGSPSEAITRTDAPASLPETAGPQIAPLPGDADLSVASLLERALPGQIAAADLGPLLERARALRTRMDRPISPPR